MCSTCIYDVLLVYIHVRVIVVQYIFILIYIINALYDILNKQYIYIYNHMYIYIYVYVGRPASCAA